MNEIDQLRQRVSTFDQDVILGHVLWYSIGEASGVTRSLLESITKRSGLVADVPSAPRSDDIFRRACTASQSTRPLMTQDRGVYTNLLVRRVGSDGDGIYRRLVEESVDTNGRRLSYQEVFEFRYNRSAETITITPLVPAPSELAVKACERLQTYFDSEKGVITGYRIREWVRGILRSLSSTVLKDGVYFLRNEHKATMDALDRLVNSLPAATFHTLPLCDDRKQREMLRQAFEDESIGEADRTIATIAEILRDSEKKVTVDRFTNIKLEYDRLLGRVAEYSDMLDQAMGGTAARLEILQDALQELLDRVEL